MIILFISVNIIMFVITYYLHRYSCKLDYEKDFEKLYDYLDVITGLFRSIIWPMGIFLVIIDIVLYKTLEIKFKTNNKKPPKWL